MARDVKIQFMIPVHNNASVLPDALASIFAQTEQDFEIHVVDDGSSDGTEAVLARFADPRLHHHHSDERTSLPGNFNRCMELASAPIYALVHADDRLLPTFAENMIAACKDHPDAGLIFCMAELIDGGGRVINPLKHRIKNLVHRQRGPVLEGQRGLELIASYNHLMCPCAVYQRRALPEDLRYPEGFRYLTDQTFWLTALTRGVQIVTLNEAYYEHRVHRDQLSSTLRASGSTLQEVRRFQPEGPDAHRLRAIWARYGAKLALRQSLASVGGGAWLEARNGVQETWQFLAEARRADSTLPS